MNNQEWLNDMASEDLNKPLSALTSAEVVYTLTPKEFLRMPELDYLELAKIDPYLQSLLN